MKEAADSPMTVPGPIRLLTAILCALSLSGCFDAQQEIWINPDGSGRLRIDMGLSRELTDVGEEDSSGIEEMADRFRNAGRKLAGDARLPSSPVVEEYSDEDFDRVAIELTVNDWRDLPAVNRMILEERQADASVSDDSNRLFLFSLEESEDGNIHYRQPATGTIGETGGTSGDEDFFEGMGRALVGAFLDEGGITVTLHSPTINRTNGDRQSGRTSVRWHVNLEDLLRGDVEIDAFTAEIGAPAGGNYFWRVVGVLLTVSVLVAILIWFRRGRSRMPPADAPVT